MPNFNQFPTREAKLDKLMSMSDDAIEQRIRVNIARMRDPNTNADTRRRIEQETNDFEYELIYRGNLNG